MQSLRMKTIEMSEMSDVMLFRIHPETKLDNLKHGDSQSNSSSVHSTSCSCSFVMSDFSTLTLRLICLPITISPLKCLRVHLAIVVWVSSTLILTLELKVN